ncbi:MAG: VWA domain-containing protein [Promethearchaeota archaeon]|nr:MAG: VWA domain-containing protein [Candidatus Lokiarchaeota archaeon]
MSERVPENIVICIDTSRSMFRSDYKPSRFSISVDAVKKLISERLEIDAKTSFSIVKFSNKPKKMQNFTNIKDDLFKELDSLEMSGHSAMGEALGLSIKILITELRKLAAKIPRILLVTDGNYSKTSVDPLKMARLAQGLNIKIDSFRLGELSGSNILKRICDITQGNYYYSNDPESLYRSAHDLAISNIKTYGASSQSPIESPAFLRKIAADLLRVQDLTKGQEQRLLQIRGLADYKKCSICFSDTNPYTKSSFYVSGRYCPNCQAPYHIHCLSSWADSQKDIKMKRAGTVRCPHCFYLIKIPTEVTQIQKLKSLSKPALKQSKIDEGPQEEIAELIGFQDLDADAIFSSCPVCSLIFEEGQKIVRCTNCNVHYHEHCFSKLHNGHCKSCDAILKLEK